METEGEIDRGLLSAFAMQMVNIEAERKRFDGIWRRMSKDTRIMLASRATLGPYVAESEWLELAKPERLQISNYLRTAIVTFASIGVDLMANK